LPLANGRPPRPLNACCITITEYLREKDPTPPLSDSPLRINAVHQIETLHRRRLGCEAQDEREGALRARPVFADQWFAAAPEEAAQDECDDDDIVELARDRDEIGDEVEGEREIAGEPDE
jgi:hypothetical protein